MKRICIYLMVLMFIFLNMGGAADALADGKAAKETDLSSVAAKTEMGNSPVTLKKLTPSGEFCMFSSYDTSPESPDGKKLLYAKFTNWPISKNRYAAEIWVCNTDGTNHVRIILELLN